MKTEIVLQRRLDVVTNILNSITHNDYDSFFKNRDSVYYCFFETPYELKEDFTDLFPVDQLGEVHTALNCIQKAASISTEYIDGAGGKVHTTKAVQVLETIKSSLENALKEKLQSILNNPSTSNVSDFTPPNITTIHSEDELPKLIKDVLKVCRGMQANSDYIPRGKYENSRNSYVRDNLKNMGYNVDDQSLRGLSRTGKSSGQVDLLVDEEDPYRIVIEGLNLTSRETSKIKEHYETIYFYDTIGNPYNILLIYANHKNIKELAKEYLEVIQNDKNMKMPLEKSCYISSKATNTIIIQTQHSRNECPTYLFHIFVQFVER